MREQEAQSKPAAAAAAAAVAASVAVAVFENYCMSSRQSAVLHPPSSILCPSSTVQRLHWSLQSLGVAFNSSQSYTQLQSQCQTQSQSQSAIAGSSSMQSRETEKAKHLRRIGMASE